VDDFVAPVTQSGKKVATGKRKGGAKMKKDPPVKSQNILSNQRALKKSKRLGLDRMVYFGISVVHRFLGNLC
jgi:hypothetical protein